MHLIDLLILLPLLWGLYKGFTRGFIVEAISLLALLLGIYAGVKLMDSVTVWLIEKAGSESAFLPAVAFSLIFLSVMIAGYISGKILEMILNKVSLGVFNKLAGAVFGTAKMVFFVSLLLFMVQVVDERLSVVPTGVKNESLLYQPMSRFALKAIPAIRNSEAFNQIRKFGEGERKELTFNP